VSRLYRLLISGLILGGFVTSGSGSALAGGNLTCDISVEPSEFTVYLSEPDEPRTAVETTLAGGWGNLPAVIQWVSLSGADHVRDETPLSDGTQSFSYTADILADSLFNSHGIEAQDGDVYVVTLGLTDVDSETYDSSYMICSTTFTVTFGGEAPLPETGSSAGIIALWAATLLGLGAASTLGISRRRA
jgi:LPXTG-motif cell wall-anchored protein